MHNNHSAGLAVSSPPSLDAAIHHPVLIAAPLGNDAKLTATFLARAGVTAIVCKDVAELCRRAEADCGAMLIAEEAINSATIPVINQCLSRQPSWSDIPVVVIASGRDSALVRQRRLAAFAPSGNVSLIERPFHPEILGSALEVALRARRRQFLVRDLLAKSQHDAEILAKQAAALREADRRKDEFLAMLGHELRNPLASIGNAVTWLKEGADNQDWAIEVIERQTHQLSRLVDDLLDVSRITRGKIHLRKTLLDAAECLTNAAAAVASFVAERRHTLHLNIKREGLWVEADPTRLEQIVVNLLTNAVKFTEPEGDIWLDAAREGQQIIISVRDSGMGIHADKIPGMFELFAQGERSPGRAEGGLGIGLTLVRRLCEMHDGSVSAHSEGPGKGCTFKVTLPAAAPPPNGARLTKPARAANVSTGTRVMVVDDNVDTANGLARLLSRRGYAVQIANDGVSALEIADAFSPRIVLLDIGLPGMDGYEVARRLRAQPAGAESLVIALSGYGQDEDRRASREAGFDHHLVKPVSFDDLHNLIAREAAVRSV